MGVITAALGLAVLLLATGASATAAPYTVTTLPVSLRDIGVNAIEVVCTDASGNIYLSGEWNWFVKYNSAGSRQWATSVPPVSTPFGIVMACAVPLNDQAHVFGVEGASRAIWRYSTADGTATSWASGLPSSSTHWVALAISNDGSTLYTSSSSQIYTASTASSGPLSPFATIPDGIFALAVGPDGTVYVGTYNVLWKVTPTGVVTQFVGSGGEGNDSGHGTDLSAFVQIDGIAVASDGTVYISEGNYRLEACSIRVVTPAGDVSTVAGQIGACAPVDGVGTQAQLLPFRIALAPGQPLLYIADYYGGLRTMTLPAPTPSTCPTTTYALDQDAAPSNFGVAGAAAALNATSFQVTLTVSSRPSLASRVLTNEALYPRVLLGSTQGSGALTSLTAASWQTFWATDDYNGTQCTATLKTILDWRAPSCNATHCFVNVSMVVPVYGVPTLFQSTQRTVAIPIPYTPMTVTVGGVQGVRLACSANVNSFACALAPTSTTFSSVSVYAVAANSWISSCSVVGASNVIVCAHTASIAQVYNASLLVGTAQYGSLAFNSTPVSIPLPQSVGSGSVANVPFTYALASAGFTYTQAVQVNFQGTVNFVVTGAWIIDEFNVPQYLPTSAIWNSTLNATAVAVYLNVAALRSTKGNIMLQSWQLYIGVRIFTSSTFADERRFVALQAGGGGGSQVVATTALTVTPAADGHVSSTTATAVPTWGIAAAAVGGVLVVGSIVAAGFVLKKRSGASASSEAEARV